MVRQVALIVFFAMAATGISRAQDADLNKSTSERSSLKQKINLSVSEGILDINVLNTSFFDEEIYGAAFQMGVVFGNTWLTGVAVEGGGTSRIRLETLPEAVNPRFSNVFFGWHNEILLAKNRIINLSIPLRVGFTRFNYSDQYVTWEGQNLSILTDNAFTAMGGVNAYINITPHFSVGGGAMYRRYDTAGKFSPGIEIDGLQYSVNFRFALTSELFEE